MTNAEEDIKKWQKYTDVSISVFWYTELEQKYHLNIPTRIGPKYESAITDKLFFDIDCVDKGGHLIETNYNSYRRLWRFAERNNIQRSVTFTSGGYQLLIGANVLADMYSNAVRELARQLNIEVDPCISLASMRRYPGSFNFGRDSKSTRNTYCIGLREDEIELTFREHVRLALEHRDGLPVYGSELYVPQNVGNVVVKRKLERRSDFTYENSLDDILGTYGYEYGDICRNIRDIIEQPRVGHNERLIVIKYLKDILGIKYGDMIILLPKLLTATHDTGNDGSHSVDDGQVDSIYSTPSKRHFSPFQMKKDGYCEQDCNICTDWMKMIIW